MTRVKMSPRAVKQCRTLSEVIDERVFEARQNDSATIARVAGVQHGQQLTALVLPDKGQRVRGGRADRIGTDVQCRNILVQKQRNYCANDR